MLGRDVVDVLEVCGHEVWATDVVEGPDRLDITHADQVRYALISFRPDWVVNCAAYTDVDGAEDHEDTAYALNAHGPETLALACRRSSVRILHMSTDYVFDGAKGAPYAEDDPARPVNVYGASKLAGEDAVRHITEDHLIVRTQWLIGLHGRNFVSTIIGAARIKDRLEVVDDQRGCPTFAPDLARAMVHLMERDARGVFHVCNRGSATWFELAVRALKCASISTPVIPVPTSSVPRKAARPACSVLSTRKLSQFTGKVMPLWQSSLEDYVRAFLARPCTG
jgi:dTDP-4-dehydrorhamnose reductase